MLISEKKSKPVGERRTWIQTRVEVLTFGRHSCLFGFHLGVKVEDVDIDVDEV